MMVVVTVIGAPYYIQLITLGFAHKYSHYVCL
jgi:hypothetical protein